MAHKSHFGFNMKIIFYDPYFKNEEIIKKFNATKLNSIDEVLSKLILSHYIAHQQRKQKD